MRQKNKLLIPAIILLSTLFISGCEKSPIPPPGTNVTSSSKVFKQAAQGLAEDCERIGGCVCNMDGIRTTCAMAFACLDAGFCQLVKN